MACPERLQFRLLPRQKPLEFVLSGFGQSVYLIPLQHLLQSRRHVCPEEMLTNCLAKLNRSLAAPPRRQTTQLRTRKVTCVSFGVPDWSVSPDELSREDFRTNYKRQTSDLNTQHPPPNDVYFMLRHVRYMSYSKCVLTPLMYGVK